MIGASGKSYYYAHLQSWTVPNGASVISGQQIATVGDTGNATGKPHLHFGVNVCGTQTHKHPADKGADGCTTNPYPYLRAWQGF